MSKQSPGQLEFVALECRAAARRIGVLRYERLPLVALLAESQQHDLWATIIDSPPAFKVSVGGAEGPGRIHLSARLKGPSSEQRFVGSAALRVVERTDSAADRVALSRVGGVRVEGPTKIVEIAEDDLLLLVDVVQNALLAMADHLSYQASRRPGDFMEPLPSSLSLSARDTLQMLWNQRAFSESSAIAVKRRAPTALPKRATRKRVTTIAKAAELGATELRRAGLVESKQGVGTWLNQRGREVAAGLFTPERALNMGSRRD